MKIPDLPLALKKALGIDDRAKHSDNCPKCGYNAKTSAAKPAELPAGINASLLLDNSPTPQLLLSEGNVIVYANKSAARVLKARQIRGQAGSQQRDTMVPGEKGSAAEMEQHEPLLPHETNPMYGEATGAEEEDKEIHTGLEGNAVDQLNIDLFNEDMRRWVSLRAVLENVKLRLGKRDAKRAAKHASLDDDIYGDSPKWNFDYYGEQEKRAKTDPAHIDLTLRETIPIMVFGEDNKPVPSTMYVSLIDPYSTGYSYCSISILPGVSLEDATFTEQLAAEDDKHGFAHRTRRTRRRVKEKEKEKPDHVAGTAGQDMVDRVRLLKDMILDEMEYCFIALSPDGDIVITNRATKAVLGADNLEASIGEGFEWVARLDIWRPDFSERLPFQEWALNKLLTERKPVKQMIGLYAGPYPVVVELRGTLIWENAEKEEGLLAALAIVVDQTHWAAKEKEFTKQKLRQDLFMSNIARELKTPIAAIIGLLELMYGTGDLNDEQKGLVRNTFGAMNSLLVVVNDIIDFQKLEAGDIRLDRAAFVLQDLVSEIVTLFRRSLKKDDVDFDVEMSLDKSAFGDGSRLLLLGDNNKIRRIAINLLLNAFKFTTRGKVTLRVFTQGAQRNSLDVKFEIEDTGIGISEDDQQRLWRPFEEVISDESQRFAGIGFGLNIAKKFTDMMGGQIGCTSTPKEGSTFWFIIPVGRPSPDSEPKFPPKDLLSSTMGIMMRPDELRSGGVPMEQAQLHIEGTHVLLVEDNWSQQVVFKKRLERVGCMVLTAINGLDAIELLKRPGTEVDVIFTDLQMPLLDGFEMASLIRKEIALRPFRRVPIVGVTATDLPGLQEKCASFGIDVFMLKPLMEKAIRDLIDRVMDPVEVGKRRNG